MSGIVTASGLVKRYDRTLAVGGLDLDVDAGRDLRPRRARTAPARRRRCGSWRRCSCPTAGDAEIAGCSVRRNPNDVRRVLGFMPDAFGVYDDMKVWEYLDFFARCYGIPADRRRRMIGDLLELVDLGRQARRLRPGPVARHAAAPVPRPRAGPRPAGAAARRAGLRPRPARPGRAARAAARAPVAGQDDPRSRPTSFPSSRSCAPRSRSSTAARSSPRAASPTSSSGSGSGRCSGSALLGDDDGRRGRPVMVRATSSTSSRPSCSTTARSSSGSAATTTAAAALLAAAVARRPAGRHASPARRATSRSCSSRSPPQEPGRRREAVA